MNQLSKIAADILNSREKYLPDYCYKLADSGSYGLDATVGGDYVVNESEMSVTFPFASGRARDGVGDLLEIGGIRTERHALNPCVLLDHGKSTSLPIGLAEDPKTKAYTVFLDPITQTATVKAFFYQSLKDSAHSLFCEQVFDLMAKRYIRSGSIGYQIIQAKELPPNYEKGTPKGLHLLSVLMLEASAVVLPANQDTAGKMLSLPKVCGKPLSPYLVKSLAPYAPQKKATVSVPLANLPKTKIPPAKWKPGVGATKASLALLQDTFSKILSGKNIMAEKKDLDPEKKEKKTSKEAPSSKEESAKEQGAEEQAPDAVATEQADAAAIPPDGQPTAAMPDNLPAPTQTAPPAPAAPVAAGPGGPEKLSAQILRRAHEDGGLLMNDYQQMIALCENDRVSAYLSAWIQTLQQNMQNIEGLFAVEHPGAAPLQGAGAAAGMTGAPGINGMAPNPEMGITENSMDEEEMNENLDGELEEDDLENDTDAMPATDSMQEVPPAEEAVEGMKNKKKTPMNDNKKSLEGVKKKSACACGKKDCGSCSQDMAGKPETKSHDGSLFDHEKSFVKDSHSFLGELSSTKNFGDEHRMKSYHYYKTMDGISNYIQKAMDGNGMEVPDPMGEMGDMSLKSMDKGVDLHPHRKMCKAVSNYFQRMSMEKAFGDSHREEAGIYQKMLDEILNEKPHAEKDNVEENLGEMVHKEMDDDEFYKSLEEQNKELETIRKNLAQILSLAS